MKMRMEYDLESLIKIFSDHAIKGEKENERLLEAFKENNPGEEIPEWFTDEFSISAALKCVCQEISDIKLKLGMK